MKLGFVTGRQLERGELPNAPILFVPNIIHLSDAAFETLKRYKGHIVLVGEGELLSRNEYDHERDERERTTSKWERIEFRYGQTTWQQLWQVLSMKLNERGVQPLVHVRGEKGEPIWGVAWLCAETPNGTVVNSCNYRNDAVQVTLWRDGKQIGGVDLLSGETFKGIIPMSSLQVRLVRLQ